METSLLLIILFVVISLGGLFIHEGQICPIRKTPITDSGAINLNIKKGLFQWTEKFVMREVYLLNTVTTPKCQKGTHTTLIQLQNHKFEG